MNENIYYCHVAPMGCSRHMFMVYLKFTMIVSFSYPTTPDSSKVVCFVPLFGSMLVIYIHIYMNNKIIKMFNRLTHWCQNMYNIEFMYSSTCLLVRFSSMFFSLHIYEKIKYTFFGPSCYPACFLALRSAVVKVIR